MIPPLSRRSLMRLGLAGLGGVVVVPALTGCSAGGGAERAGDASYGEAPSPGRAGDGFYFVQLSDVHLGLSSPAVNPDPAGTLERGIAAVNALAHPPAFVIFTGDLSHNVDDDTERRRRLTAFKEAAGRLRAPAVHVMPGEHDAALDRGAVYQQLFGAMHYTFDVNGVHAIVLDTVSDPDSRLGAAQLDWLRADLASVRPGTRILVFTHRPLFDLFPAWDWHTRDGQQALDLLLPYPDVTVFYGHIHQEHHHQTGHIAHHSARSLMYALPAPGSVAKKAPLPWDAAAPYAGLGFREVEAGQRPATLTLHERPLGAG